MSNEAVRDVSPKVRTLVDLRPISIEVTAQQISEAHAAELNASGGASALADVPDYWPPDDLR